jgi:hypothetical protein
MGNINMDVGDVGWSAVDWIGLAQDRESRVFVNAVMNLRVP